MFQKSMYLYIVGFVGLRKAINYVLDIYLYIVGFAHVWGRPSTGYPDLRAWSNLHFKADIIYMNIQQGRMKTDMQKMLMKSVHNWRFV